MNLYETMFIVDPEIVDEVLEKILDKFKGIISKGGGEIIKVEDKGLRNLAYRINKKPRGHYFLFYFMSEGALVRELERNMRIDEGIMRFIVIKSDKDVDELNVSKDIEEPTDTGMQKDKDDKDEDAETEIKEAEE